MTNISKSDRKNFIGASEVAALFGAHPQITLFELWHRKAGNLEEPDLSDNERVFWGNTLEPAIAKGIAEQENWKVRRVRRYIKHPKIKGFGSSLDYEVQKHVRGMGALEIKNVDRLVFKDWPEGTSPLHYSLQVQAQLACTGWKWGAVGTLVGGNEPVVFKMDRHEGAIQKIERKVAEFWKSVEEGNQPQPDFNRDLDTIADIHGTVTPGKFLDLTGEEFFEDLCCAYDQARIAEKISKEKKDAAKAEILLHCEEAERIRCSPFTINRKNNFRLFKTETTADVETVGAPTVPANFQPVRTKPMEPLRKQASIF